MIDPYMRTNQSRHTVNFGSVGQEFYEKYKEHWDDDVDVFPKAWQVGRYLRRLCDAVTTAGAELRLNTEVVSVVKVDDGLKNGKLMKWRVTTRKTLPPQYYPPLSEEMALLGIGNEEDHIFDHLVIASGFFGTPKIPTSLQPWVSTPVGNPPNAAHISSDVFQTLSSPLGIPVIHSSSFHSLSELLNGARTHDSPAPTSTPGTSRRILVVGGSMSGAEVASSIASELSSNQNSPGAVPSLNSDDYEIIHIAARPFWTLPRYLPIDVKDSAPRFLPLDMVLFNLVNRPRDTLASDRAGAIDEAAAKKTHAFYSSLSGQSKPHAWIESDKDTDTPWLAICDDYTTHSLCGNICTFRGRLTSLLPSPSSSSSSVSATITTPAGEMRLDNVAAVVLATGFSSKNSLEFMTEKMKQKLEYEAESYAPLYLTWQGTISPSMPTLGFVGMYNGPFWGVMEQQALILSTAWAQMDGVSDARLARESEEFERGGEEEEYVRDLGRDVKFAGTRDYYLRQVEEKEGRKRLTQFPMGDYIHVMFDLLSLRGKTIPPPPEGAVCWPLVPDAIEFGAYDEPFTPEVISPARHAVQGVVDEGLAGKFFPRTLFRAFLGQWNLERTIISKHPSYPSGTLTGVATFHPRTPTHEKYSGEYLYDEQGDFKTDNGLLMKASRRYVWRLEPGKNGDMDKVSQWFVMVKGEYKDKGVDYIFHELDIIRPEGSSLAAKDESTNGAACPMTKPPVKEMDEDGDVRGGWASKSSTSTSNTNATTSSEDKDEKREEDHFWTARGHHLCIDDTYDPEYVFTWKGAELEEWTMAYTVKGPGKDYWIHSKFTRPSWD